MDKISAVIINYNGKEFLNSCLNELAKHEELFEIVVVDDASDDGSEEVLEDYQKVKLIKSKKNSGPIYSRQAGFEETKGEYVVFIDCDILIQVETIRNLYEFLKNNDDFWLAGAKLSQKDGSDTPWNFGHFPSVFKNLFFFALKRNKNFGDQTKEVGWVAEACFMVKKSVLQEIGGFDTNVFMYHEAPDISMRAKKIGHKTAIVFGANATHLDQKTKLKDKDRFYIFNETLKYFYKKHYSRISYFGIFTLISIYYFLRKIGIKPRTHYE